MRVRGWLRIVVLAVMQVIVCEDAEGIVGYWVLGDGDGHCDGVGEVRVKD